MRYAQQVMTAAVVVSAWMATTGSAAAQVFRCKDGERTVYQQSPCEQIGAKGAQMKIDAAPTGLPPMQKASAPTPADSAASTAAPVPTVTPQPQQPAMSRTDRMAEQCLDWYRSKLRDPRGAYQRNAGLEKNIVSFDLFATNGFGGYVQRRASCEFKGNEIDGSWTAIHAGRLGW